MKFFHVILEGNQLNSAGDFLSEQTKDKIDYSKIKIDASGSLEDLFYLIKDY